MGDAAAPALADAVTEFTRDARSRGVAPQELVVELKTIVRAAASHHVLPLRAEIHERALRIALEEYYRQR